MNYLTYLLIDIACLFQVEISQGKHKVAYHSECPFECWGVGGVWVCQVENLEITEIMEILPIKIKKDKHKRKFNKV